MNFYILGVWVEGKLTKLFLYCEKEDAKADGKKYIEKGYQANVFPVRPRNRSYGAK